MSLLTHTEYLVLGRQIARLLGSALEGSSAEALRDLARAYDPSADEVRISAEVFLFHKYLLMQACVGVFPESQVDHVVGGLFAALNERASGLELSRDRQEAMERMCGHGSRNSIRPSRRIEFNFSMKDRGRFTGKGRSSDFAGMCGKLSRLRTSGRAPMAHPISQAILSPQRSIG